MAGYHSAIYWLLPPTSSPVKPVIVGVSLRHVQQCWAQKRLGRTPLYSTRRLVRPWPADDESTTATEAPLKVLECQSIVLACGTAKAWLRGVSDKHGPNLHFPCATMQCNGAALTHTPERCTAFFANVHYFKHPHNRARATQPRANLGCLRQEDGAVATFRDYLRKACNHLEARTWQALPPLGLPRH
jgi:hypothetical protein